MAHIHTTIDRRSPAKQVAGFIARFDPSLARLVRAARGALRKRFPTAIELVYDNYNALVIGFGTTDRASDALFSIVLYPRWVTLFFLDGARLRDPKKILEGSGKIVRHIVLKSADDLDKPEVRELMKQALGKTRFDERRLVIKSISKKQRPRRPR